jgi:alkylation response protein AidB-like acyl-CoA dehydrogenase
MNFDLSDEQKDIAETFRRLLRDRLPDPQLLEHFNARRLDRELWRAVCELGAGGLLVSEAGGGLGMDLVTLAVVSEVLGFHAAPLPVISNALAAWLIERAGNIEQRDRWLAPLLTGEAIAAFALGETQDRWLPQQWTFGTSAPTEGLIDGAKCNVAWGCEADLLIVGLAKGRLGLIEPGAHLVKKPLAGVDQTRLLADLDFVRAPVATLAADAETVTRLLDAMLVLLAADACGAGSSALHRAVAYAKERQQFGRVIGRFQALKHQLADMAVEIEPARPLCWYAAHAWDVYPERRTRIAALTKAHVTDGAVLVAREAVEAHGGIGYTWDYPIHVFLKRAIFDRAFLGGPRVHRQRMAEMAGW